MTPKRTSGKAVASLVLGLLSLLFLCVTGLPGLILGVLGLNEIRRAKGRVGGKGLAVAGTILSAIGLVMTLVCVPVSIAVMLPAVQKVREAADRVDRQQHMKHIGLGVANYESAYLAYPPAWTLTKDGKPGLSWRVLLLPYVEQEALYRQFRIDEPWDSPTNKPLLAQMPALYSGRSPKNYTPEPPYHTNLRVFVGNGAAFDVPGAAPEKPGRARNLAGVRIVEFIDGASNTLMIAEMPESVEWTRPEAVNYDPSKPPALGLPGSSGALVIWGDGHVSTIRSSTPPQTVHALITRGGGEVVAAPFN